MSEDRDEVVVFEDLALDLLGERLPLSGLVGGHVSVELRVEILYANPIGGELAATFEIRFIPVGPAGADAGAVHDDLDPGPFLHPALLPLQENRPLHDLELRANADRLQLRDDALAARIIVGHGGEPVDVEAIGVAGFLHQLLCFGNVAGELRPFERVLHVVIDPVAADPSHPPGFGVVDGLAVDRQAHRLAHPFVMKRALRIQKTREL